MSAVPCTVAADTARHLSRLDAREAAEAGAQALLLDDFRRCIRLTPRMPLETPAWSDSTQTAPLYAVVLDGFSGASGEASLIELLLIVATVAQDQATTPAAADRLRKRAVAWIEARAKEYAEFHAADLAAALLHASKE